MKKFIKLNLKKISLILILFLPLNLYAQCQVKQNGYIKHLLGMGVTISQKIQTDFGRFNQSSNCYLEAWPSNTQEVAELVSVAYQNNLPIRTQGASHSQNGSSLPHAFELLIHTTKLNQLTFDHIGSVTVGSGIPILLIKEVVEKNSSFILPVANSGDIAPTVGGYISAGGISPSSFEYGGFWEHVFEITLVTGNGKILSIKHQHPLFLYLFGSMGQFGIITQVKLNLIRDVNKFYRYPFNQTAAIQYPTTNGYHWKKPEAAKTIHWLNLFVPLNQIKTAHHELLALQKKYPHALNYRPIYQWQVTYVSGMPPLLYHKKESFIAMGIWGNRSIMPDSLEQFKLLQKDFRLLVKQKNYKSYIQTEITGQPAYYKDYFPNETWMKFQKLKSSLDPKFLFNKGNVF